MKKILSVLFIVILAITLTGCGSSEKSKEPLKIELTSENFAEYFSISAQVSDFTVDEKSSILGTDYIGYANLKIVVNPKKEFKTEDVSIGGKVTISGMCWSSSLDPYFEVVLDMNGKAEYTKTITTGTCPFFRPDMPTISKFYQYELKENEFFTSDDSVLITLLSGSIYEEQ